MASDADCDHIDYERLQEQCAALEKEVQKAHRAKMQWELDQQMRIEEQEYEESLIREEEEKLKKEEEARLAIEAAINARTKELENLIAKNKQSNSDLKIKLKLVKMEYEASQSVASASKVNIEEELAEITRTESRDQEEREEMVFLQQEKIAFLQRNLEELKNICESTTDELSEVNDIVKHVRNELADLQSQKSLATPSEEGESLYDEKHERLKKTQETFLDAKRKYLITKENYTSMKTVIDRLNSANKALKQALEDEERQSKLDNKLVTDSYEANIKILKTIVASYEQELADLKSITEQSEEMSPKIIDEISKKKDKQIKDLDALLSLQYLTPVPLSVTLMKTQKNLRYYKEELKRREEMHSAIVPNLHFASTEHRETQTDIDIQPIITPTEPEVQPEDIKPNGRKKVTFSEVRNVRELPSNRENEPPRRIGAIPRRVKPTIDPKTEQKRPLKFGRNLSKKLE